MEKIDIFKEFLQREFPKRAEELTETFQTYHKLLVEINSKINLISRKMPIEDYWTLHYLDSLLATKVCDFSGKKVLDFGTGGGIPGVPLSFVYPDAEFNLLDSKRKKLYAIDEICETMDLPNVDMTHARLEEFAPHMKNKYDIITCRSVRIIPELKQPLLNMLKPGGILCLYKSVQLDDVAQFKKKKVHDLSMECLGTRNIVIVNK